MISEFLHGMNTEAKVFCLIVVAITVYSILSGLSSFVLHLVRGQVPRIVQAPKPVPSCAHSDNLRKLCLRGPEGCDTERDCKSAVEDGEY